VCGYAVYRAQTPEAKLAAKQEKAQQEADLDAFVAKLRRIRASLPRDASLVRCPTAGTHALTAPMVDSLWLGLLLDDRRAGRSEDVARWPLLHPSGLLAMNDFSDDILNAETLRRGGDAGLFGNLVPGQAELAIGRINEKASVVMLSVDEMHAPLVDAKAFTGGSLAGAVAVVDWKTEKVLCHGPVEAESSGEISYGGGVRLKLGGLPVGTVGSTERVAAVRKDFQANVQAAISMALSDLGAD